MTRVLVTGFAAFDTTTDNPSARVASSIDGASIEAAAVTGVVLPVAAGRVREHLDRAIDTAQPTIVLLLGVAPGRTAPALERVAVNICDFPVPDVDGARPIDEPVVAGGPDAYLSELPIKAMLAAWQHAGVPGYLSNTAGTYVCNQAFYLASHRGRRDAFRAGLLHLPATPASVTAANRDYRPSDALGSPPPTMGIGLLEHAVRVAVAAAVTHRGADLPLPAGTVC